MLFLWNMSWKKRDNYEPVLYKWKDGILMYKTVLKQTRIEIKFVLR